MRMFYAVTLAETGRKDEALREGAKALEISPDDPMMLYNCACLYARLGETAARTRLAAAGVARGQPEFRLDAARPGSCLPA